MDTFRYFSKRGVEVKVISGDNPVTVSEIAKKAGIPPCGKTGGRKATLKTAEAVRKAAKKIHGVRQGDTGAETSSGAGIKRAGKDRGNDRRRRERYSCVKRCRLQLRWHQAVRRLRMWHSLCCSITISIKCRRLSWKGGGW